MADTSKIVDSAIDRLCYPQSNVQDIDHPQYKICEDLVRKAAALGFDDKEMLGEAANVGLPEKLAGQICEGMQRRHNETRQIFIL
jgi:hypothetical protein